MLPASVHCPVPLKPAFRKGVPCRISPGLPATRSQNGPRVWVHTIPLRFLDARSLRANAVDGDWVSLKAQLAPAVEPVA